MDTNKYNEKNYSAERKNYMVEKPFYTCAVRAGRRRYYFDAHNTRGGDRYITITETRKKYDEQGVLSFESSKLFLFKEDFEKFASAFTEVVDHIASLDSAKKSDEVGVSPVNSVKADAPVAVEEVYSVDYLDFDSL